MLIEVVRNNDPGNIVSIEEMNMDSFLAIINTMKFYKDFVSYRAPDVDDGRKLYELVRLEAIPELRKKITPNWITIPISVGNRANIFRIINVDNYARGMRIADIILEKLKVNEGALGSGAFNAILFYPKDGMGNVFPLKGYHHPTGGVKVIRELNDIDSDEEEHNQNFIESYYA